MTMRFGKMLPANQLRDIFVSKECGRDPMRFPALVMRQYEEEDFTTYLVAKFPEVGREVARTTFVQCGRDVERAVEALGSKK